ncbi:helix-turn-helix domain-containing protein [Lihuaxuella thermophila]|uniref:Transcriptional regulator, contains XRE-family HTH domain n=1 Tax=Lihuaxuella thermophila TaxID=1173111 RepID=A0A1H8BN01_9BACL|nr:helix-turn-helix transcriptional regulator [Lihuaxuella thermophila]SEM84173.1 Transcriptional regulator, contains XRE-family HTH domain [Lihuaxuella thermophila]
MILDRVIELRKRKRWSLQFTADQLGIAKSTYAGYESGYRRPSLEAIKCIADLFETSVDYLIGRVDTPTFPPEPERIKQLELTQFSEAELTVDGKPLSDEEINQFIAFIRSKREIERMKV